MKLDVVNFTNAQLKSEINRCEYCEDKPCLQACPAHCSPADFIMAAKNGQPRDYERASAIILGSNPLGGVCGYTCPDYHCMKACTHKLFDRPVNIPAIQSSIINRARLYGKEPLFNIPDKKAKTVCVIGGGPAGLGTASVLLQKGYSVTIHEKEKELGGMARLIPDYRLPKETLDADINFVKKLGNLEVITNHNIDDPESLNGKFDAVVFATGLNQPLSLNIPGSEYLISWLPFLKNPDMIEIKGRKVAIIGGGAIVADVASACMLKGAKQIDMIALEKLSEMPLSEREFDDVKNSDVVIHQRTKVKSVVFTPNIKYNLECCQVELPENTKFHPTKMIDVDDSDHPLKGYDHVFLAIGARSVFKKSENEKVFYTGDMSNGPTTVVEAVAAGKNTALQVDAFLSGRKKLTFESPVKSYHHLDGRKYEPVSLETDFFGRKISSPFLLSAAPPSDGYAQMIKAYEAGWAGGVMKTAFDDIPIHIPSEYMFAVSQTTFANCDNVSGHPLKRVCKEIGHLVEEFPDRLTMASTGGPVSGNDDEDKKVWQSNTKMLEEAGAMGIEYSLSCPQGGDGTHGDIVSQDAELTAKIIDWVMQCGDKNVPKLFKLTGAVTAIQPILMAIKEVFERYPDKKAGITLANSFPALLFRDHHGGKQTVWQEGVIVGLSGDGVTPISNLTLSKAASMKLHISANGGPMDYLSAANFLAMGTQTVQFCTIVMKHGYHIIDELKGGLSYLLAEKKMSSLKELIGCALPNVVTDFMDLPAKKLMPDVLEELCTHCGNCTRCSYMALSFDENKIPRTDYSRCVGCSICVQKCFTQALYMRERQEFEVGVEG